MAILSGVSANERPGPGDHLVKHDAERVDVGRRRHRAALDLLGRHVRRGARDLTASADMDNDSAVLSSLRAPPRQAEIRDDHPHLLVRARRLHEHDVLALEVPMHDPDTVRRRQAGGHLPDNGQDLGGREPPIPPELVGQRLAVQQLHREKHDLVGRLASTRGRVRWRKTS